MKNYIKKIFLFLGGVFLIILIALEILSHNAADIFNKVMQNQDMLNGTITVEKINANLFGEVNFKNLLWKDINGDKILEIPDGSFKVNVFDVLTDNFKSTTLQKLSLKNVGISINFDENMNVDFIRHSQDFEKMQKNTNSWKEKVSRVNKTEEELKKIGENRRKLQQSKIEEGWKNFNVEGKKLNLDLKLENCHIEIFYRDRHYLLQGVQFETQLNTNDKMNFRLNTGAFGGTMIGRGMSIQGNIDFKPEIPQCNLLIILQEIDPSSLGFGVNIHDEMTLSARFTGFITKPVGKGKISMKNLNLPGIIFKNVEGNINYDDAMIIFTDVTADVYGGKLKAYGDYNIDTRYYNIYGFGDKLKAYDALPQSHLHCNVDLNITINSNGNAKETVTSGDFVSGEGRYSILMFESLSGRFRSERNNLNFYDVNIDFGGYKISTDALSIVNGKLTFDPIKVTDKDGKVVKVYEK